jgi:AraC-like DNA-binding protein
LVHHESKVKWEGGLVLGPGIVTYFGSGAMAAAHRHDAVQIVVGLDHHLDLTIEGVSMQLHAAVVPVRIEHSLMSTGRTAVILAEPFGRMGEALTALGRERNGQDLWRQLREIADQDIRDVADLESWSITVVEALTGMKYSDAWANLRPEIVHLRRYVEEHLDGVPRLSEIAAELGFSERQLRRIMHEELGMPFRRYILWRRLRIAALQVHSGADLTTAAMEAGFSDSAHLSRVFRQMFGMAPSDVLPYLQVTDLPNMGESWPIHSSVR